MRCKCKVGRCANCTSSCKRCGCGCDGVLPVDAMSRKPGCRGPQKRPRDDTDGENDFQKCRKVETSDQDSEGHESYEESSAGGDGINSVKQIWRVFDLSASLKKKLPSKMAREEEDIETKGDHWYSLVRSVQFCVTRITEVLYPFNPPKLLDSVALRILKKQKSDSIVEKTSSGLSELINKAPRRSIQGRVLRAVLVKYFPKKLIDELKGRVDEEEKLRLGGNSIRAAYADYNLMAEGLELSKASYSVVRFDQAALRKAVAFILSSENVSNMSWGHQQIKISPLESVSLPLLVRRRQPKEILDSLYESVAEKDAQISRGSFYEVVKLLTCSEESALGYPDPETGVLVNDQVDILLEVLYDFVKDKAVMDLFVEHLEVVRNFLKVQYKDHVAQIDDVSTHGVKCGLDKHTNDTDRFDGKCNGCKFPFYVVGEIRKQVEGAAHMNESARTNALQVLEQVERKFVLFQARRVQEANQKLELNRIEHALREECESSSQVGKHAIIRATWRSKTHEVARKAMSWNCLEVRYFEPKLVAKENSDGSSTSLSASVPVRVYIEQIVDSDKAHDAFAAASLIEAGLECIREELPHIESVTLQSEPSDCYKDPHFTMLLGLINSRSVVKVEKQIHVKASQEREPLDRHFANIRSHLSHFMQVALRTKLRAIASTKGLAAALIWNGGVRNTCVQLVSLNRAKFAEMKKALEPLYSGIEQSRSSCSGEVVFDVSFDREIVSLSDIKEVRRSGSQLKFTCFESSGVGTGVHVSCSFGNDEAALVKAPFPPEFDHAVSEPSEASNAVVVPTEDQLPCPEEADYVAEDDVADIKSVYFLDDSESQGEEDARTSSEIWLNSRNSSLTSADAPRHLIAPERVQVTYGPSSVSASTLLTGIFIEKCSKLGPMIPGTEESATLGERNAVDDHSWENTRKDLLSAATREAHALLSNGSFVVYDSQNVNPVLEAAKEFQFAPRPLGWASYGFEQPREAMGYIDEFMPILLKVVQRSGENKSSRIGVPQLRGAIKRKNPFRYDIPGTCEIRTFLAKLAEAERRERGTSYRLSDSNKKKRGTKTRIPNEVTDRMENFLRSGLNLKPKVIVSMLREEFPTILAPDGTHVSDQQLRNKWNAMKASMKM